jgi:hypothetical protein
MNSFLWALSIHFNPTGPARPSPISLSHVNVYSFVHDLLELFDNFTSWAMSRSRQRWTPKKKRSRAKSVKSEGHKQTPITAPPPDKPEPEPKPKPDPRKSPPKSATVPAEWSADPPPIDKHSKWVMEAITVLATKERNFVSFAKIKNYLCDYMANEKLAVIPKLAKRALLSLVEGKWVTAKNDSYALSQKGKQTMASRTVEKRRKVDRTGTKPVVDNVSLLPKVLIYPTGRISAETVLEISQ